VSGIVRMMIFVCRLCGDRKTLNVLGMNHTARISSFLSLWRSAVLVHVACVKRAKR
jgi:hypothetical protein